MRAVTFDFWNTLVFERGPELRRCRLDAWEELLDDRTDRATLEAAYDIAWHTYNDHWHAGRQFVSTDAVRVAAAALGVDVSPALQDAFDGAADRAPLNLAEGIGETLRALDHAGLRIGVICDVGFTGSTRLRQVLDRNGLLDVFDHFSFSDEVGYYKPAREIFDHALTGLGIEDASSAAHIGDIRRTDIGGARARGMFAIRYRGVSDDLSEDEPEGDVVIDHHAQLLDVLLPAAR